MDKDGFFIDFLGNFFKFLGINWKAYIFHSSLFNLVITIFSFKIFNELELKLLPAFTLALCVSVLSYPVSGTPFLDLHSAFLSLFALYFLLIFLKKKRLYLFIFFSGVTGTWFFEQTSSHKLFRSFCKHVLNYDKL